MSLVEFLISYCCVIICSLGICIAYKKLSFTKVDIFSFKNLSIVCIYSLSQMIVSLTQYNVSRMFIAFLLLIVMYRIIFKEALEITFIKTIILQLLGLILELFYSFIIYLIAENIMTFDNYLILKNLTSILINQNLLLIVFYKNSNLILINIINLICDKKSNILKLSLVIFYIFIVVLIFYNMMDSNNINYIINNLFSMFSLLIIGFLIIDHYKFIKSEEKQTTLLEFITKYEKLIDRNRINKHEMLNNLIILSTYKDKNTKEFNDTLNEMIKKYSIEKDKTYRNIGHLSTGIKGVFYYKMSDIELHNIEFIFYCSKNINKYLTDTTNKNYNKCCQLLGIFMDNAVEAAKNSIKKKIIVDIYIKDENVIFYIENSISKIVNIEKIKEKNYSSKGKNRGLGLHIANKLKLKSKNLDYVQYINSEKNFVTELCMKIK